MRSAERGNSGKNGIVGNFFALLLLGFNLANLNTDGICGDKLEILY